MPMLSLYTVLKILTVYIKIIWVILVGNQNDIPTIELPITYGKNTMLTTKVQIQYLFMC